MAFQIKTSISILTAALISAGYVTALADGKSRPDAHAPISVMAEHSHSEGEFMFSYRFMNMEMDGNLDGSDNLSNSDILVGPNNTDGYLVAPLDMTMDMHMLGMMYAPSDTTTLMLMVPYIDLSMDHLISDAHPMAALQGEEFTTEASGIGDVKIGGIFTLEKTAESSLLINLTLSLPTGSIDEEDEIGSAPALGETQLPFPMQIGSGTYDLMPGITYNRVYEKRSWGTQVSSVVRIGENDNGYTLGNRAQAQAWHAWLINSELSVSTRLVLETWDNIDGDDSERKLPAAMPNGVKTVPTVNPQNHGGKRADFGLGLNGIYGEGEHRVALELVIPAYQSLDGPQMERDRTFVFGYQKAF